MGGRPNANVFFAVLPGRRVLKGAEVISQEYDKGVEPDVSSIGTKRQRSLQHGADAALDEEDEEDDDGEDILTKDPIVRVGSRELNLYHAGHE